YRKDPFLLAAERIGREQRRREIVGHLEDDLRPVWSDAQSLKRASPGKQERAAVYARKGAHSGSAGESGGRVNHLPGVLFTPANLKPLAQSTAIAIRAAFVHHVGQRADGDRLACRRTLGTRATAARGT